MQRLRLTATREQLLLRPEMTSLIFGWYTRANKRFSALPALWAEAITLTRHWNAFLGEDIAHSAVSCGPLGAGPHPTSRSLRLPLSVLIMAKQ